VVFYAPIATGGGVAELLGNNGNVLNTGIELSVSWKDKIANNCDYHINFNATTIHNEVLELEGREYIPSGLIRETIPPERRLDTQLDRFMDMRLLGFTKAKAKHYSTL
jgi:hypothetical protein